MAVLRSFTAALLLSTSFAHPGHNVAEEALERAEFMKRNPSSVRSCAPQLERRGHAVRALTRRHAMAVEARAFQDLDGKRVFRRDFAEYNFTHESNADVGLGSLVTDLFTDNSSCVLQPEVTQGPYYVDGETIRSNVTEGQRGVPLYLDVQLIDTSTCQPVPAVFVDIWHCNATGVYSGVEASGNGNSNDTSNLSATFLRGIQETDINGVVQFQTIVPGHYTGRAPHIHVLSHNTNDTLIRTNGTLLGSNHTTSASHVGQIFFDQGLLSQVFATELYLSSTEDLTLNSDDTILSSEAADMDPFVEYVMLGDKVEDGIMAWITLGIDPTVSDDITSAATIYESGGVANSDNSIGMGRSGGPSGAMPSGTAVPSGAPSSA